MLSKIKRFFRKPRTIIIEESARYFFLRYDKKAENGKASRAALRVYVSYFLDSDPQFAEDLIEVLDRIENDF